MPNQQLLDYIKQQLAQGVAKEVINTNLLSQGWQQADIAEGFSLVENKNTVIPQAPQILFTLKKNKITVIFVVIGILLLLGLGIGGFFVFSKVKTLVQSTQKPITTQNTLEEQAYSNAQYGFKINAPKGWRSDESGQMRIIVAFVNAQADREGADSFYSHIAVTSESAQGLDLDSYVIAQKDALSKEMQNYKLIEDNAVSVDGMPARLIGSSFLESMLNIRILRLIAIKNGQVYIITGMTLESVWNQYKDIIESSLLTFTLN